MYERDWNGFTSKVVFTFEDGTVFEATGKDMIAQVDLDKKMSNNNNEKPFGTVNSNTIMIKLNDIDKLFVKTNKLSPYYGKLKEGFKIEFFLKIDDAGYERSGIFYNTDLTNSSDRLNVSIKGADILQYIFNTPVNIVGVKQNQTVKQYLEDIFKSVGLVEGQYDIDNSLDKVLKYTYTFGVKFKDILNDIAQSYMCNIFVDNKGIIKVVNLLELAKITVKQFELTPENKYSTELISDLLSTFNSVKVEYSNPTIIKDDKLLGVSDLKLAVGTTELSEFMFDGGKRALSIDYVTVTPKEEGLVTIDSIGSNQNSIMLNVSNHTDNEISVDLLVKGGSVNENTAVIERYVASIDKEKRKYIDIKARLIQTDRYAVEYCDRILKYLSADISYVRVRTKGHPLLDLGYIVGIVDNEVQFNSTCILSSISLSFGSQYSCNIEGINCEALQ